METINKIIDGYNSEKLYIIKCLAEMGDYTGYSKTKIQDLKDRLKVVEDKISVIYEEILQIKNTK